MSSVKARVMLLSYICISVFRQGDIGYYWYAVLSGTLDVNVSETGKFEVCKDSITGLLISL